MPEGQTKTAISRLRESLTVEMQRADSPKPESDLTEAELLAEAELAKAYKQIGKRGLVKLYKSGAITTKELLEVFPPPKWVANVLVDVKGKKWVPFPGSISVWKECVDELAESGDLWMLGSAAEMGKAYNMVVRLWKKKMVQEGYFEEEPSAPKIAEKIGTMVKGQMEKAALMLHALPTAELEKVGVTLKK